MEKMKRAMGDHHHWTLENMAILLIPIQPHRNSRTYRRPFTRILAGSICEKQTVRKRNKEKECEGNTA